MNQVCSIEKCTGCAACVASCSQNAISLTENQMGFKYPTINTAKCVNCGLCLKVCPQNNEIKPGNTIKEIYGAFSKNTEIRKNSSSGGIFSELAKKVINGGGVVYASRMSSDCRTVYFDTCARVEDIEFFRGSKYLQSDPGLIYRKIKKQLADSNKQVLFVGTGCQVAGLRAYLGKKYDNLMCVDIICHGVPSPKLWREHISVIESHMNDVAQKVNFRYKYPSWTEFSLHVQGENGKDYIKSKFDDEYLIGFLTELTLRPNCYSCPYASTNRTGDITLADFWGYKSTDFKMRNTEKGISLVLINTDKGHNAFDDIASEIRIVKKKLKEAMSGNRSLKEPWCKNPKADEFWNAYIKSNDLASVYNKYCIPYRFPLSLNINWFILNHLYLVPKPILRKKGLID